MMPPHKLRRRRSWWDEPVDRDVRVRVADGEVADDEAVTGQAELAPQDVRIAGHAELGATAQILGHQAEHDQLQEQPHLQEGAWQVQLWVRTSDIDEEPVSTTVTLS